MKIIKTIAWTSEDKKFKLQSRKHRIISKKDKRKHTKQ
jgi:hypothetical protein